METITEDQFFEDYKPIQNHIDINSAFDGCMFETYGEEKDFVLKTPENQVWTVTEAEDTISILSGVRLVNRLGFLVTEKPYIVETEVTMV